MITRSGDRKHCGRGAGFAMLLVFGKGIPKAEITMKVLAQQITKHGIEPAIAQAFVVLALVIPSLFAFLASLMLHSPSATAPGLWFFYQISLNVGYGAIPVAVGLTALAIYGRETSARSTVAMVAVCVAGIVLTWYAGQL
jgi:hypothetical protein